MKANRLIINIFLYIVLCFDFFLIAQTELQIKQAKELISRSGMSEKEVIDAAKSRGYSEKQINNFLKK